MSGDIENKEPSITDKIIQLKEEYHKWKPIIDTEIDPMAYPELLRIRKELACLSLDLAIEVSKSTRKSISLEGEIEFNRYTTQHALIEQGIKIGAAESAARALDQDKKEEYAVEKGWHRTGDMILKQVNEILFSLRQEIAIVKKEYENYANQ